MRRAAPASASDDVASSPFLAALLDHVPDLPTRASSGRWLILVPRDPPPPHRLTLALLESHVLVPVAAAAAAAAAAATPTRTTTTKPPPLEYVSLSGKRVSRPKRDVVDVAPPDFAERRRVRVLFEEKIYVGAGARTGTGTETNGEAFAYVVACVNRPLEGGADVPTWDDGEEVFAGDRSQAAWWEKLERDPACAGAVRVLSGLDAAASETQTQHGRVPSPSDVAKRAAKALDELRDHPVLGVAFTQPRFLEVLSNAVEACAQAAAYATVFASLAEATSAGEKDLQLRLHEIRALLVAQETALLPCERHDDAPLARLGLVTLAALSAPARTAVRRAADELAKLNMARCPSEKLACIVEAGRRLRTDEDGVALAGEGGTDEALSLFVSALVLAAPGLLLANLAYVEQYSSNASTDTRSEAAYDLAAFRAAVALVQSHRLTEPASLPDESAVRRDFVSLGGSGGVLWGPSWARSTAAAPSTSSAAVTTTSPPPNSAVSTLASWFAQLNCAPSQR